ncbi:hypothetical protein [Lentzea sp. NPDC003310]|uniref:hypothetical protein n=1 Tax=Lentzea sp. NPDC003310 TaxID=3154447 RepID=UPI0033B548AF
MATADWAATDHVPLLLVRFEWEELAQRYGFVFTEDVDELGPVRFAVLATSFGQVGLVRYTESRSMRGTAVYVEEAADHELVHRAVVREFGLTGQDISWARRTDELLVAVRENARVRELLAGFGFDVRATDDAAIDSEPPLELLAVDSAGGRFHLTGDAGYERQVLHVGAEGTVVFASGLREALQLVIGRADGARAEVLELLRLDLPAEPLSSTQSVWHDSDDRRGGPTVI